MKLLVFKGFATAQEISDDLSESRRVRHKVDVVEVCHIMDRQSDVETYKHLHG